MVIYNKQNGNRELIEKFAELQKNYLNIPPELSFLVLTMEGSLQIGVSGKWYKYEYFNHPFVSIIKSAHGVSFLQVTFDEVDLSTGEITEKDAINYYPFELIDRIVVE